MSQRHSAAHRFAEELRSVYLVGIKGTGMAALAVLLAESGIRVSGSDSPMCYATERGLRASNLRWDESSDPALIPGDCTLLIHSAAYSPQDHPQIQAAARSGIPVTSYPEFLGRLSSSCRVSCCISGTHGKTTTSALIEHLLAELSLPHIAVYGSFPPAGNAQRCLTPLSAMEAGVFEACEYRRHFLVFRPHILVITSVEFDHPDSYADQEEVLSAFITFAGQTAPGGTLIYCADDPGAAAAAEAVSRLRPDIRRIPYGITAEGPFAVTAAEPAQPGISFTLACAQERIRLPIPGRHSALNGAAASAAAAAVRQLFRENPTGTEDLGKDAEAAAAAASRAFPRFGGLLRRSEVLGSAGGVLVMDDYAHHPTEIRAVLQGLKESWPERRITADFMPHTFSRTEALFDAFSRAFAAAQRVLLHPIYPSAREQGNEQEAEALGRRLADAVAGGMYVPDDRSAAEAACRNLKAGDIFITLGAGSNRVTAELVLQRLEEAERGGQR
jgi:UDP-N-acetylmuramate--alanine ligase